MSDISINIFALIPFLTLLQSVIFFCLFILRGVREEYHADFWAAIVVILLGLGGIPYMFGWLGWTFLWEKYTYLPWDGFSFAVPPALYLYLKSLTNSEWRFSFKRDAWHFWAYGLHFFFHLIIGSIWFGDADFWQWWHQEMGIIDKISLIVKWLTQIYYFWLAYTLYQQYRRWTFEEHSNAEQIGYQWFRNIIFINFFLSVVGIFNEIYVHLLSNESGNSFYALMWLGYLSDTVLIYYLSISAYGHRFNRTIFFKEKESDNAFASPLSALPADDNQGYQMAEAVLSDAKNSVVAADVKTDITKLPNKLSEAELSVWKNKVLAYFDAKKPYLQPELTLSDLAEQLKTNTSVLSQVINAGFEKNFNDFVNAYRVEEFKQKITTPQYQHLTRLAVAFDCGFNSKATFNRAFKKLTGQNPSDF